jgi:hypothetical protein
VKEIPGKYHCGSINGAGKATPPGFITSGLRVYDLIITF